MSIFNRGTSIIVQEGSDLSVQLAIDAELGAREAEAAAALDATATAADRVQTGQDRLASETAASQAALYDGPWLDDVAALLADTTLTYTGGSPSSVAAGDYVRTRAEGFSYEVAASAATDQHVTTAGGVKLYVLASSGTIQPEQFGHPGDASVDALPFLNTASAVAIASGAALYIANEYAVSAVWVWPAGLTVTGPGNISTRAGFNDNIISVQSHCVGSGFRVVIPNGLNQDAVIIASTGNSDPARRGVSLSNIAIAGGNSTTHFALSVTDSFIFSLKNIDIRTGSNGVKIANTTNLFNYGNATVERVEVTLTAAGRIGWDIFGIAGTRNYNIISFNYISAITGVGTGTTGVRIRNCSFLTFINADFEGVDTAVDIEGGVSSGAAAQSNVFINGYLDGDIILRPSALRTVFVGGRCYGAISIDNAATNTQFINFADASGDPVALNLTSPNLTAPNVIGYVATGPRLTPSGMTVELRNQIGSTVALGRVVAPAGVDYGFQLATGTDRRFYGVTTAEIASTANGPVAVAGIALVESTTLVTRGDTLVLNTGGSAGTVRSIGTAAPGAGEILFGYGVATNGGAGLCVALIKQ